MQYATSTLLPCALVYSLSVSAARVSRTNRSRATPTELHRTIRLPARLRRNDWAVEHLVRDRGRQMRERTVQDGTLEARDGHCREVDVVEHCAAFRAIGKGLDHAYGQCRIRRRVQRVRRWIGHPLLDGGRRRVSE